MKTSKVILALTALVLAAAMLLSACGVKDDSKTTAAGTSSAGEPAMTEEPATEEPTTAKPKYSPSDKLIALTFDDGPRSDTTSWLLEQLELREVPATFFMVGSRMPGNEDLIRQMKEQGCQIGVHTYDHVDVTGLSQTDFDLQIGKTRTLLREILGEGNYWLRPPYGFVDQGVRTWSDGPIILWSVDPEDWKDHDVERIVASVVERVEDGDVILMHDIYQSSAEAAIRIVDALEEKGFCFVTVEQLMARQGIAPEAGVIFPERP